MKANELRAKRREDILAAFAKEFNVKVTDAMRRQWAIAGKSHRKFGAMFRRLAK